MPDKTGFEIELDISDFTRSANQMIDEAGRIDRAFEDAMDSVSDAITSVERELASIQGDVGFAIDAQYASIEEALRVKDDLGTNTSFTASVTETEITNAVHTHDDLNANTAFVASVKDSEIETAVHAHDDLNVNTAFTANVNDADVTRLLEQIRTLSVIDVGLNVASAVPDAVGGLAGSLVSATGIDDIAELDRVANQARISTGELLPNVEELINTLFLANFGESRTELGQMVTTATLLGVEFGNLQGTIESTYKSAAITGFGLEETLRAQQSLVKNGLAPTFEAAGLQISAMFQAGLNSGDDLLDVVNEYGSTFSGLGFTFEQTLSTLNSGLAAGADNTDRIADSVREFGILAREGGDEFRAAVDQLDLTDLYNSFLAGQSTGAEFFGELTQQLGQVKDIADQAALATATIGPQSEDFTVNVVGNINPFQDQLAQIEATTASMDLIGTDLNSQVEEFARFAEDKLHGALQNAFDIEDLIDNAKNAFGTFMDTLESGGSVGEALGIAISILDIPVVDDFQRTLSTLVNGMLEAARTVMGALGQDTSGISSAITDLGTAQFEIDINTAQTQADLEEAVGTALERGVQVNDAYAILVEQMNAAIERGNFDLAAEIRDNIQAAGAETETLLQIFDDVQNYVPAFREGEFENRAAQLGIDADEAYARINQLQDSLAELNLPEDFFTQIGEHAGTAFNEGYLAQLQTLVEGGQLGEALSAAAAAGDTEAIGGLATRISDQFFTALEAGNAEQVAALTDDAQALLATLEGQFAIHPDDAGLQEWIAQVYTALEEVESLQPQVISEEDVATTTAATERMASQGQEHLSALNDATYTTSTDFDTMATSAETSANDMVASLETMSMDSSTLLDQISLLIQSNGDEFTALAELAEMEFPRIEEAFAEMAAGMAESAGLINQQVQAINQAIASIVPPPVVPIPTIPTGSTAPPPTGSTMPPPTGSPPIGGTSVGSMLGSSISMIGGSSVTNIDNRIVTFNQVVNTQSSAQDAAAMAQGSANALRLGF